MLMDMYLRELMEELLRVKRQSNNNNPYIHLKIKI
jgi:hypothetical protein